MKKEDEDETKTSHTWILESFSKKLLEVFISQSV